MEAFLKTKKSSSGEKPNPSSSEGTSNQGKRKPQPPWVEKYRPKNVDDVVEQNEVIAVLQQCIQGADLPNLLLYGPPGTGKTSTILAAARQLFGDMYKERILELNASDERGINVVRSKIKNFAQLMASGTTVDGKPCPPFKIIILDEADSMTNAAQTALRRTMEKECGNTRFCLICNYVSRIIEPITSRCTKFRFKPLSNDKIIERLKFISSEESLQISGDALNAIVEISNGDMRRAITVLQACHRLKGAEASIEADDILELSGIVPIQYLSEFIEICKSGDYKKLKEFVDNFALEAYSIGQMLEQLNEYVLKSKELNSKQKSFICDKLGECSFRLQEGGSEFLQIMDLGCGTILEFQKK